MATPMRHAPSQQGRTPSQMAGAAPTPPVSTPFSNSQTHAAFSPPQGSRTSPQALKKSPATSQTLKGLSDGTAAVNFDSPSATAALGALGINDLGLDNISMGAMGMGRSDEDDRKRRMDAVGTTVKAAGQGRVSNEGLERLARSIGLECLWEDNLTAGPKSKNLFIAGAGLALEISITNHVVDNVALTLPESTPSVQEHVGKAADILLRDLKLAPGQWALTKTLERFQPNLERIASLDQLSVLPTLNCYDAIDGVYQSLTKIHKWDVAQMRKDSALKEKSEDSLRVLALCTRHGCPLMHARDRIGLSLDYWKERRRVPSTTVDSDVGTTWSILIECAPKNGMAIMPVRVSQNWVPDAVEKAENLPDDMMLSVTGPILDWQEPDNILLPAAAANKGEEGSMESDPSAMSNQPKLPDVMFVAAFDPPLIVSSSAAIHIHNATSMQAPNLNTSVTFDALVFPVDPKTNYDPSENRIITHSQAVPAFARKGKDHYETHKNVLNIDRAVYGQVLTKVPIEHPRQLMDMLPTLRQYAFLSTLLSKSFKPVDYRPKATEEKSASTFVAAAQDDFAAFMKRTGKKEATAVEANGDASKTALAVDIALTMNPVPRFKIVFPFLNRTANITLEIHPGGKVHIISDNVFDTDGDGDQEMADSSAAKGKGKRYSREQWAEQLEVVEDIGMWIERIKYKFGD
ncbi:hypothetical protein JX265_006928 [Neoarthrinium moseri]|uniref:Mediator of RNA polymerase II transcription subunit 1 n=1 Tax=Neoarthrinium moseri TaxID=1658444 RepID=A0A9P9WL21_9PEZI|nr:hypothetical protein JX265_006928 [Neoarthrinium moseri]